MDPIEETRINLLSEGTTVEGTLTIQHSARVHGTVKGSILGLEGSTLILGETGVVEGNIDADSVLINGFVRGEITASKRVVISETGRVVGNVQSPSFQVFFGGFFEGQCSMEEQSTRRSQLKEDLSPSAP